MKKLLRILKNRKERLKKNWEGMKTLLAVLFAVLLLKSLLDSSERYK
jgi:hypothetical protein